MNVTDTRFALNKLILCFLRHVGISNMSVEPVQSNTPTDQGNVSVEPVQSNTPTDKGNVSVEPVQSKGTTI